MAKEIAPIDAIKDGTPDQKQFYLRKALWSDDGFWKAKDKVREDDLIFWLGGEMPHLYCAKRDSGDKARELVERFRDGVLPEEGWHEWGICLEGMKLLVTDKDLNILSDITISEDEIAKGMTRDGIRLVCDGVLFDHAPLCDRQVEVTLEGVGESATWAWTMHTRGKLELSELEIRYRIYRDQHGCQHSVIVSYGYGKSECEIETHQWRRVRLCRYAVRSAFSSNPSDAMSLNSDVELRLAIEGSEGETTLKMRAWRGSESFPVCEIVKNQMKYAAQYKKFSDCIMAWHGAPGEFVDDWEADLGIFGYEATIALQEELTQYEIHDYRSTEVRNHEAEFRKVYVCQECLEDVILDAGWKPSDGEDAAVKIVAQYCGVSEEIARCAHNEGVWECSES